MKRLHLAALVGVVLALVPSGAKADGGVQPIVPVAGVVYGSRYKTLTSTPAVTIDTTTALLTATKGVKTSTLTFMDGTRITSTTTFAGGGTITNVIAGAGLAGGGTSGAVAVSVSSVSLSSQVVGNLPVTNLAGGSGASNSTFWRGDGTWVAVSPVLLSSGIAFGSATNGVTQDLTQFTWNGPLASGLFASTATVSSMTVVNGSIGTGTIGTATIGLGGTAQAALFKGQSISFQNGSTAFGNHFDFNMSETFGGTSGSIKYHGTGAIVGSPSTPAGFSFTSASGLGKVGIDTRSSFDGPALFIPSTASFNFGNGLSGNRMVGLRAPDSVSVESIWKLPPADAAGAWVSDGALNLSLTPVGILASTQTWTGQHNWVTPAPSSFTYGVVVGSLTANDLTASLFVKTDANKKLSSFDLNGSSQVWTGNHNWQSPTTSSFLYGLKAGSFTITGISTGTPLFTDTNGLVATGTVNMANQVQGILAVANGGSGSASPAIVAGANVTVSGSWPNQTINAVSGGASALGVFNSTVSISSPTIAIAGDSTTITAYLIGTSSAGFRVNTSSVTAQGNTFNSANQLVKLSAGSQFPAADGNLITNLNAAVVTGTLNIASGTLSDLNASTIKTTGLGTFAGGVKATGSSASVITLMTLNNTSTNVNAGSAIDFYNGQSGGILDGEIVSYRNVTPGVGDMAFLTNDQGGTSNLTEKMRIQGTGNVGINTTNPIAKFHVNGDFLASSMTISGISTVATLKFGDSTQQTTAFTGDASVPLISSGIAFGSSASAVTQDTTSLRWDYGISMLNVKGQTTITSTNTTGSIPTLTLVSTAAASGNIVGSTHTLELLNNSNPGINGYVGIDFSIPDSFTGVRKWGKQRIGIQDQSNGGHGRWDVYVLNNGSMLQALSYRTNDFIRGGTNYPTFRIGGDNSSVGPLSPLVLSDGIQYSSYLYQYTDGKFILTNPRVSNTRVVQLGDPTGDALTTTNRLTFFGGYTDGSIQWNDSGGGTYNYFSSSAPFLFTSSVTFANGTASAKYVATFSTSSAGPFALSISTTNHVNTVTTSSPTLSSCGTGPTIVGTDFAFTITGGTAAGGCTATFARPYTNVPVCQVGQETMSLVNALSYTVSATAVTITQTGLGTNKLDVICIGRD